MFCLRCSWVLALLAVPLAAQTREVVAEGTFTRGIEGPAVDRQGRLYAVNFREEGTIGRVDTRGRASLFVKLPPGSTGNGIRIDAKGYLYVADYTGHNILKIHPATRAITVHAHGPDMRQPNDLALARSGRIYASDPDWSRGTGRLWRIDPDGRITLLEEGMGTTNGIEISPDERRLYVNESVQRRVWCYDLDPATGRLSGKRLLHQFPDRGLDGMRCDTEGNLYVTRYDAGEVVVLSPAGETTRTIRLKGQKPSNLAFGGKDGRTVYVTLQDRGCIESFTSAHPGREWVMLRRPTVR